MPTLEIPFVIGQKVYHINTQFVEREQPCPACKGTGILEIVSDNEYPEQYKCPSIYCKDGKQTVHYNQCWRITEVFKIESIHITDRLAPFYNFKYGDSHGSYPEHLFATKEEALEECRIRNERDKLPRKNDDRLYQWNALEHRLVPIR